MIQRKLKPLIQNEVAAPFDFGNIAFFSLTPLITIASTVAYFLYFPFEWKWMALLLVSFAISNMSITCGYHRYFSHMSYRCHPLLEFLYLFFGAGAFQGPVLEWTADHRRHHVSVDTELDPYNINRGFWWAHMGWFFIKITNPGRLDTAKDLQKKYWVMHQYRFYVLWAIAAGVGLPTLVGYLMGNAFGGFVFGAGWRMLISQQSTFLINSLCHMIGRQPYTDRNTACDSLPMAIATFGEGYHNFHHRFQADYRNGVRWHEWDPTKWAIFSLSLFGVTWGLRRTPNWEIIYARMSMDEKKLIKMGGNLHRLTPIKQKIEEAQIALKARYEEYSRAKLEMMNHSREKLHELKAELKLAQIEMKSTWALWRSCLKILANQVK